jgi:hypothetical protein
MVISCLLSRSWDCRQEEAAMTGLDLIMAALVAGAGAGVNDAAKTGVHDAYEALRALLRRRMAGRPGTDVETSGADRDEEILAAARRVLALTAPEQSGSSVRVGTNYGAAGAFLAPVTIHYGTAPTSPPLPGVG